MNAHKDGWSHISDKAQKKRTYKTPMLLIYGKVASLTRSAAGSCTNDGVSCTPTPGGTRRNSERRVKESIVRIGTHPLGIGLYLFGYKPEYRDTCGHGRQFGVMVDEVEKVMPGAVSVCPDGYKMVNYAMLGISQNLH